MNHVGEILKAIALGAIRFYQAALRPMNPWGCKYYPSCSNYALEALDRYGLARGAWLAARRLLRCHPLVFGGFDPVPARPCLRRQAAGGPEPGHPAGRPT